MSSTYFETVGSSSGRRLYIEVRYSVFYITQHSLIRTSLLTLMHVNTTCIQNHRPEDETSGSKHVANIKN